MWMALLVLLACGIAMAEQPVVWYPARQAPDSQSAQPPSGAGGQQPSTPAGQPQEEKQPSAPPAQQPETPTSQQPAPPATPPRSSEDPRLDQPLQPLGPIEPAVPSTEAVQPAVPVLVPDTTPLNSPMELTLGSEGGRNYLYPSIRYTQFVDHSTGAPGAGTMAVMTPLGTLEFNHSWSRAQAMFTYSAGGTIFPTDSEFNSSFQSFNLTTGVQFGRWSLALADSASYLPESSFGYYGLNGLGGPSMGAGYLPNQSILTPQSPRVSNTVSVTLTRALSARSTLHFSGGWGILRYQGGGGGGLGFNNANYYNFSGGYDRTFGANSLGIAYLGSISDTGTTETITTHGVNLTYARRLTGRLALQLGGGPAVRIFDSPAFGSDSGPTWEVRAGLTYAVGRLMLSSTLYRYTTSVVGVLGGVNTFMWQTTAAHSLARVWNASGSFGIARNSTLSEVTVQNNFNTEFAYVQLTRLLGRETSVFISYNFQHQTSDFPLCLGCGTAFDRHVVGVGFEWHKKPLALGY